MEALRLVVDARTAVEDTRGIGRCVRAVLRRLAPRDDVALTLVVPGFFNWSARGAVARAIGTRRFRFASRVPRDADVVWHPANGTFLASDLPAVATIHDAAPFRFPNADARHAERDQAPFRRSARTAARIAADSHFGAGEINAVFGVPLERVTVIHLGVDPPLPERPDPFVEALRPYALFVGNTEHRKGYDLFTSAMSLVREQRPEINAVATQTLGYVDDARLAALYRGSSAFIFPSRYEGFGLPILEAMSYGAPVVTCSASSMPEVAGDAAHYVPPDDDTALAEGVVRIASDAAYAQELRERGLRRAQEFPWERTAEQYLTLFARVASP